MRRLLLLSSIIIITACSQENIIHIELLQSNGLQVDNQVRANEEQIGFITDVRLSENGLGIIASAKLDAGIEIPLNSYFELVSADILGTKMIEITYSNEDVFYENGDTVEGFYIDPIKNLVDSMLLHSIDSIGSVIIEDFFENDTIESVITDIFQGAPSTQITIK
jgi:phospholipid/cholesterol/gamma-HCH transport system substrate-binding protein